MNTLLRKSLISVAAVLPLAAVASCSSGGSSSASASSTGSPTSGGTAVFAERPGTTPDYIFPMVTSAHYSVANIEQFERLMYRSLYWIGKNGQPVVDESMSLAKTPQYSDHDSVVTITLKNYNWSDGKPVAARDVQFWINLVKANKDQFAEYTPGEFPDNVKAVKVVDPHTIRLTLNASYNPTWFTNNQLSQISPLPQHAWDKTSANGKVGNYDQTTAGAKAVYKFLAGQAKNVSTYGSNPLWKTVDGPWILTDYRTDGYAEFVPNKKYSGPDKPRLSKFIEQPFTSASSELNVLRAGKQIDYGYLPIQESSQAKALESAGYRSANWDTWGIDFFVLNFNNPTVGPIIKQTYVRQAMQKLIDQKSYIQGPLNGLGWPTCGPVPLKPTNPFVSSYVKGCPFSYDPAGAKKLLKDHGWTVNPGGTSVCDRPGKGANECGQGVAKGAKLSFNLQYASGDVTVDQEMQALKSAFSGAGINIKLSSAPFNTVIATASPCKPSQSSCSWQMENWGGGWTYGVDPYPTGDQLFATGSGSNFSNYSDKQADTLIQETLHSANNKAMVNFQNYLAKQMPVLWMPMPVYQISMISTKLQGVTPQSPIESLTPERWYFTK